MTDSEAQALRDLLTNKDVEIEKLHRLLIRAADTLEGATKMLRTDSESKLIDELRNAAD